MSDEDGHSWLLFVLEYVGARYAKARYLLSASGADFGICERNSKIVRIISKVTFFHRILIRLFEFFFNGCS